MSALYDALMCADPADKLARVDALTDADAEAASRATGPASAVPAPGRPERPRLIDPKKLPRRGLGSDAGRAALVHAVAHIEFNAVNLALDAAWRFRGMPPAYYHDWLRVARDEARHFRMLNARLGELGHAYGDLDAHNGLWEMAVKTDDDVLVRMALVPRVLEARGLDVTPGMIRRLRQAGDDTTPRILEIILEEEVPHVAIGSHWFRHCCAQRGLSPDDTFAALLAQYMGGAPKGPFNEPARLQAGFNAAEMAWLQGRG